MKTHKQFEKYIHTVIKKYVPKLLLQRNIFEVNDKVENSGAMYECVFNYPYLNVIIHYSEKSYKEWLDGRDQEPFILHEMCHVITDPLYAKATSRWATHDEVKDERELLTDYICNIVLKRK